MLSSRLLTLSPVVYLFGLSVFAVWPRPSHYSYGNAVLWILGDVDISYVINTNTANQGNNSSTSSAIVTAAIQRARKSLVTDHFVPRKSHPRNSDFEPATAAKVFITKVLLQQNASDVTNTFKPLDGSIDESYTLTVLLAGTATITSISSIGILYGLETLTQLFYTHTAGGIYTPFAPVLITDAPQFVHRGLNMDVSRNYYAPSDIMRTIDALSWNKFNRLHLHVTDAQSWPLVISALPDLATKGAYGAGLWYNPQELADIQEYGMYRGVEVNLEIDMPGHTASIALAYPDLIAAFNVQKDWGTYGNEPPTGQLKLNSPAVYTFLDNLWRDLLPRVAPYSAYFHTGGDELNNNVYLFDETVGSNDSSIIQPFLQKFVDFNHAHVRAAGLTPIVWEEMLLVWNLTLGDDVVVQTWLSDASVAGTVTRGHKALVGNYNYWYLDCGKGAWIDSYPESAAAAYPFNDYCTPTKNWRLIYSYDPLSGVPADSAHLVLGGEVHIWSEQTDPVNLDNMVWPRASAAAEVLWSGAKDAQGNNRSQVEASPRLNEMRERMVRRGIKAGPVQMAYCTQNGTQCAL